MHAQVLRSLHIGHASLLDQAHSLKLELPGKLPSLHDPPPAPSKHLTRCLRNRVQANTTERWLKRRPRQRNIFLIISLFIAATKTCPISLAISKSRDIASRASTSIAGEESGRSVVCSLHL